jgi:membrane fusion protein (multidrug efflux system)
MKRFLTRKELKVKRKEMIYMVIGIAVILSLYFIFTREKKPVAETPIVSVMPASQQNVQIFGEYVGRIRAQQFVEVRARVELSYLVKDAKQEIERLKQEEAERMEQQMELNKMDVFGGAE